MEEPFDLPVEYKGEEQTYKATPVTFGHIHKFHVTIGGQVVIFEPDEERNYRAVIPYENISSPLKVDAELLKAISSFLEEIFK